MSWNESGNGRRPGQGPGDGPSDLDKIAKDWQRKIANALGGKSGKSGKSGQPPPRIGGSAGGSGALIVIALVIWAFTGFYRVDEAERALVLRFGEYLKTEDPGLHWRLPYPIDTVEKIDVAQVSTYDNRTRMLTADEAFVVVNMAVQYRRTNPVDYRFQIRDAESTLQQVSESAIREIVGRRNLDDILLANQALIAQNIRLLIQETMDGYKSGVEIVSVNLQEVEFPEEVSAAVQDAVKAREDQRTTILEAQTYSNDIIPRARGQAKRQIQEAEAYQDRVIADAEGNAARFSALLLEYEKAPRVTRDRLYIEAVESVFRRSAKVILDDDTGSNLTMLPLDKLIQQREAAAATGFLAGQEPTPNVVPGTTRPTNQSETNPRSRRTR